MLQEQFDVGRVLGWRCVSRTLLQCVGFLFLLPSFAFGEKPNFIVILTDDQGYGDLGCHGSQVINTPCLDQMATEGIRFTDFYVASPFCSPSRAALLTGRVPAKCGVPYVLFPTEHHGLPPDEITLAEQLQSAGYATGMVGKWHLGWRRELRPRQQGFDDYFGLLLTNDCEEWKVGEPFRQLSNFEPLSLRHNDEVVEQPVDQTFLTEKYTQKAVEFIQRHRDRPFFLYLAHSMPHVPQYASPKFSGRSQDGLYGDCIEEIDASTGRILKELRDQNLAERTLVIFTSDNGANVRNLDKPDINPRFPGRAFGGSNGRLRGGKGTTFEGGVRVPCIAWWPGTINGGRVENSPCSTLDLFPTFSQLSGAKLPNDRKLDGLDISHLLKTPKSEVVSDRLLTHYFGVQLQAVRQGKWKLFVPIESLPERRLPSLWFDHQPGLFARQHRTWQKPTLYDIVADPSESNDLADQHPGIVSELLKQALTFDSQMQESIAPLHVLNGPLPPKPGQIRQAEDELGEWLELIK
jgi:arylsulfatase A-like enzyme